MKLIAKTILIVTIMLGVIGPIGAASAYFMRPAQTNTYLERRNDFAKLNADEQEALKKLVGGFADLNSTQRALIINNHFANYANLSEEEREYVLQMAVDEINTLRQLNAIRATASRKVDLDELPAGIPGLTDGDSSDSNASDENAEDDAAK